MRKINSKNLAELKVDFSGIVVGIPKESSSYAGDFYIVEKKIGYLSESPEFLVNVYFDNSLMANRRFQSFEEIFVGNKETDFYCFDSMEEFCIWYLQSNKYEICSTSGDLKGKEEKLYPGVKHEKVEVEDDPALSSNEVVCGDKKDKEWIHEKCGTNTPPTSIPEKPSVGNKKKDLNKINKEIIYWEMYNDPNTDETREKINPGRNTRRTQLKDVIYYINERNFLDALRKNIVKANSCYSKEYLQDYLKHRQQALNEWLDGEVE